jgi:hypothetical protein
MVLTKNSMERPRQHKYGLEETETDRSCVGDELGFRG